MCTALAHAGDVDAVVVVPCDTPWLSAGTIGRLVDALAAEPAAAASAGFTDRVEPLCAAWRVDRRAAVEDAFATGERRIHAVLAALGAVPVPVAAAQVRNVNTPGDLHGGGESAGGVRR